MKLTYFLAEACKNTFVFIDHLKAPPGEFLWDQVHYVLLKEERDDALILTLEKKTRSALYIKMHVLGADGKFGVFCGNGARCAAAYLFFRYPEYKQFYLITEKGSCPLFCLGKQIYAVHLPQVQFSQSSLHSFSYGEILEPHLAFEKTLSDQDLHKVGLNLNQKPGLFPDGINVNAWSIVSPNMISVKTYERGVQRLTKSCGTGSSVCASLYLKGKGKVFVKTPGGHLLVRIQKDHLELIGPATCSFSPIFYGVSL